MNWLPNGVCGDFWERPIILMSLIPVMRIFGLLVNVWNTTSIIQKPVWSRFLVKDEWRCKGPRWDNLEQRGFNTTQGKVWAGYVATTAYYFYSFDPADNPWDVTCVFQEYINENGKNKEVIRCNPLGEWFVVNGVGIGWLIIIWKSVSKANSRIATTGINWILMRYSDIYLMLAEAQNVLTGPDAANWLPVCPDSFGKGSDIWYWCWCPESRSMTRISSRLLSMNGHGSLVVNLFIRIWLRWGLLWRK